MRHDTESSTITTWSGRHIDLLTPESAEIHIDDICASLSKQARFYGHTRRTYTVAEHLLLGLEQTAPPARFRWLTHDFPEAYLGDVAGPLKNSGLMQGYRELEEAWQVAIDLRFGITFGSAGGPRAAKEVRVVDARMLVTEQRDLQGRRPLSTDPYPPFALHLPPREPSADELHERLLRAFYTLAAQTEGAKR